MIKNIQYAIILLLIMASCSSKPKTIIVRNFADFDRTDEIVEINIPVLNCDFANTNYTLLDINGKEIPYQILNDTGKRAKKMIFPASVAANSTSSYKLVESMPKEFDAKTYARFVKENKDDFAWENDYAAYRMFGAGRKNENPSNGVDLWFKRTEELVIDKFYDNKLVKGLSFNIDRGQGLDAYEVSYSLGAGGVAPFTTDLWIGSYFNSCTIIENGPLRSVFKLTYDSLKVDSLYFKQIITIIADAGSILNKAIVHYEGVDIPMKIAAGIFLHHGEGVEFKDTVNNVIGYAEKAVDYSGISLGRSYVGVYAPGLNTEILKKYDHLLIASDYRSGYDFTYFFGGGWSKWKFAADRDWFEALVHFSKKYENPLKVSFK